jgi:hypothetical protein
MSSFVRMGLGVVFLLGVLLAICVYALLHDPGQFEIKEVKWSPLPLRRVALVAKRSDREAMSSDIYFVLIADHVLSAAELRKAYHSPDVVFAASSDCLHISWTDPHHLLASCRNGTIDPAHIAVRKPTGGDVAITYVNIADSTAKAFEPLF